MIQRRTLKCRTCGHQTTIRTAIGHEDYQEFAFPCGGCGLEIRYGMKLLLNKRVERLGRKHRGMPLAGRLKVLRGQQHIKYVNLINARWCDDGNETTDTRTFDGETLNPIDQGYFSPFMATVLLPKNVDEFRRHQVVRTEAANFYWPQIQKLLVHLERKQWPLFDKQLKQLEVELKTPDEVGRIRATFRAVELNGLFFVPPKEKLRQQVRQ